MLRLSPRSEIRAPPFKPNAQPRRKSRLRREVAPRQEERQEATNDWPSTTSRHEKPCVLSSLGDAERQGGYSEVRWWSVASSDVLPARLAHLIR